MSEAGIPSGNGRGEVPFRSRAAYVGHEMFGSGDGAVLVEPEVARDLRRAAELQAPHETGGLLYGRVWRDGEGRYVLVDGFVQAGPDAGKTGEFSLSPMGTQLLRETAARSFPASEEVGWWHTHRAPSPYSQTDFTMQRAFRQPASVGLLVFASGTPWATAYLGPDGRGLGHPGMLPPPAVPGRAALVAAGASGIGPRWNPFRRGTIRLGGVRGQPPRASQPRGNPLRGYRLRGADDTTGPPAAAPGAGAAEPVVVPPPRAGDQPSGPQQSGARASGPQPAGAQPSGSQPAGTQPTGPPPTGTPPTGTPPTGTQPAAPRPPRSPDTPWQPQRLDRTPQSPVHHSVGARVVLWLAVSAGLGAVIAIIVLAVSVVSRVVHAVDNAVARPSIEWSCHHNGLAPGVYACAATTALPPGSTVWWLANGKPYHKGLLTTITVHRTERVEAVLVTPSGQQYSTGSKALQP